MVCVARLKRRSNATSTKANLRISAQLGGSRTRHHDRSRDVSKDLELAAARHHLALMFFSDQRDGASEKSRFGPFIDMTDHTSAQSHRLSWCELYIVRSVRRKVR